MLLLIDGYNLLHQSDLLGRGRGERWLQQARERLVQQLTQRLDPSLAAETWVVFDAAAPPPDLPHRYRIAGIQVTYAVGYPEADDLLEELIARHAAPRRLAVVSSDHRVQRAARRRRATFFDADAWYVRLVDQGPQLAIPWPPVEPQQRGKAGADREKPLAPIDDDAVRQWMRDFQLPPRQAAKEAPQPPSQQRPADERQPAAGGPPQRRQLNQTPATPQRQAERSRPAEASSGNQRTRSANPPPMPRGCKPPTKPRVRNRPPDAPDRPRRRLDPDAENPFPDGYGEDLLE